MLHLLSMKNRFGRAADRTVHSKLFNLSGKTNQIGVSRLSYNINYVPTHCA